MSDHNNDLQPSKRGPDLIMVIIGVALVAIVVLGYLNSTKVPRPGEATQTSTPAAPATTTP